MRHVLVLVIALGACTPAQAPVARKVGKILSLGGVGGMLGGAATNGFTEHTFDIVMTFSVISVIGIGMFAAGELATPAGVHETLTERNHRWAKVLTERAAGAARDGRCPRVRRLEVRVRGYDREIHDFVFMRDPEIMKCMTITPEPTPPPPVDPPADPAPPADPPAP
jgi:hypothetical protein